MRMQLIVYRIREFTHTGFSISGILSLRVHDVWDGHNTASLDRDLGVNRRNSSGVVIDITPVAGNELFPNALASVDKLRPKKNRE